MTKFFIRSFSFKFLVFLIFFLFSCSDKNQLVEFKGKSMGTLWKISCKLPSSIDSESLGLLIEERLYDLNDSLSAFKKDSALSSFNNMKAGESFTPDPYFSRVLAAALEVHKLSGGVFDPTIMPLVNLWGFGPDKKTFSPPDEESLQKARESIGFEKLIFNKDGSLGKKKDGFSLDFGAIAKGFGVDILAEALEDSGIKHYLIEIGGEIRVSGCRPDKKPWRIGISEPSSSSEKLQAFVELCEGSIATSGSYRNFFDYKGRRFSHIIDPEKASPVESPIISVSVRHSSCMMADAFATAIMLMGLDKARNMVKAYPGLEAFIIWEGEGKAMESWASPAFFKKAS